MRVRASLGESCRRRDPASTDAVERIELRNLADDAMGQLSAAVTPKRDVGAIEEEITVLIDD
jgi:hypothetical protein